MANTPDTTLLVNYAGTYRQQLITRLVNGLQVVTDCTLRPNIKVQENMTKLFVNGTVKPASGTRTTTADNIKYEPRSLTVQLAQYDLDINTVQARKTWMGQVMKPGVNPTELPFEQTTWQAVMDDFGTKINDNTVWNGVRNDAGTGVLDIANGFGTIIKKEIQDQKITPVVTGTMLTDTVEKAEAVYKSLPSKYRATKMFMYCSFDVYDAYCEDYATRFGLQPIYDKFGQVAIRHSNGNCILKPVTWIPSGVERVVVTPQSNMLVGTDLLSDATRINTHPTLYTLEAGIIMAFGLQIEDLEPLAVNDHL
ncbi:MAG: hypothetical protein ACRYFZ_16030 [Janthinobacterium lividum]